MPRDRRFGRCRDCIAWNVIPHEWNGKSPCFAHPPTVLFDGSDIRPFTRPDDGCFEWQAKETPDAD